MQDSCIKQEWFPVTLFKKTLQHNEQQGTKISIKRRTLCEITYHFMELSPCILLLESFLHATSSHTQPVSTSKQETAKLAFTSHLQTLRFMNGLH